MARQKSEDRVVPDARGNSGGTRRARSGGGGKAIPVKEVDLQLTLLGATADNPRVSRGANGRRTVDRSTARPPKALKAPNKPTTAGSVTMVRLEVKPRTAWRNVYQGRQSLWALSHNPAVDRGLRNAYFAERGLVPLLDRFRPLWADVAAPVQLRLPWDTARSRPGRRWGSKPVVPKSRM